MARKIEIEIVGDTRSLEKALSKASRTSQSNFQKIGKAAGAAGLALGAGLAVAAKVGFDELAEGQRVAAQTAAVLKSTGQAANVTAKQVETLAQSLSEMSGVDDEAIAAGENLLLTFTRIRNEAGKGNDIFTQGTKASLDMSVAMGTDLNSAIMQVGKALNDPIRGLTALRRVGVSFTEAQEKQIRALVESGDVLGAQKIILAELTKEFGGSAKAAGETLPGQLSKARNAFEELSAALVEGLLPAINAVLKRAMGFIEVMQRHPKIVKAAVVVLGAFTAALLTASAAQLALNIAVLANPYVAAIAGVIALGVAITVLVKKVEFFRRHWQLLLATVGIGPVVIATAVKAIVRHFDTLQNAFNRVKDVAVRAWGVIRVAVMALISPILAIIRMVNLVISAFGRLASAIRSLPTPNLPSPGGGVPFVPGIQSGGDIARSGLAVVHRGERVVPARVVNRGLAGAMAGGGEVRVIVVGGDQQAISYLQGLDRRTSRKNGGRGILG